jgi:hypothetical protein
MTRQAHVAFALLLCSGMTAEAGAQGARYSYYNSDPMQFTLEGGAAVSTGATSSFLDSGFTLGGGVVWHPAPGPLAFRVTFDYTRLAATQQLINDAAAVNQTRVNGGTGEVYGLRFNGVYEWPVSPYAPLTHAYITAGLGGAYEEVSLTQTDAVPGLFCTWWVCGTAPASQTSIVARNNTTRFTWNAGVGLNFAQSPWQSWFIEAAFEKVRTPQPTTFMPIRIGVRF